MLPVGLTCTHTFTLYIREGGRQRVAGNVHGIRVAPVSLQPIRYHGLVSLY